MASDVDIINSAASEYLAELNRNREVNLVLCKCEKCDTPEVPLWERINFVARSTASRHFTAQRAAKRQPPARKGANLEQSFWKPVDVIAFFEQEALRALQDLCTSRNLGRNPVMQSHFVITRA